MSGIGLGDAVSGGLGGSENSSPFTGFITATRAAMDKLEEQERLESQVGKTDEVVKILRAPTRVRFSKCSMEIPSGGRAFRIVGNPFLCFNVFPRSLREQFF